MVTETYPYNYISIEPLQVPKSVLVFFIEENSMENICIRNSLGGLTGLKEGKSAVRDRREGYGLVISGKLQNPVAVQSNKMEGTAQEGSRMQQQAQGQRSGSSLERHGCEVALQG